MDAKQKLHRNAMIEQYLDENEFQVEDYAIGDFLVTRDETTATSRIVLFSDVNRGFPDCLLVLQWNNSVGPCDLDIVRLVKEIRVEAEKIHERDGLSADLPLPLAMNYNQLSNARIFSHLDALSDIAEGRKAYFQAIHPEHGKVYLVVAVDPDTELLMVDLIVTQSEFPSFKDLDNTQSETAAGGYETVSQATSAVYSEFAVQNIRPYAGE